MNAIVTFESVYGNTRAIAEAVAEGLSEACEVRVSSQDELGEGDATSADLLVVGAPTHMHGLPTSFTRKMAARASEDEHIELDPSATAGPGIRGLLSELSGDARAAAAFDTRGAANPALTGSAARGIAKRLRRRGFDLIADPESFLVDDSEGPLAEGELDRAREWGRLLAGRVRVPRSTSA
jgi:flavodoxin-like protein